MKRIFLVMFKKRLEYIVAKEQAKKIEDKKCEILFGKREIWDFSE